MLKSWHSDPELEEGAEVGSSFLSLRGCTRLQAGLDMCVWYLTPVLPHWSSPKLLLFLLILGSQRNASDALILISYWCSSSQVRGSSQIEWLSLWKVLNPIFISSKCITLSKFNYTPNFFLLWKMKLVIICASQECMCVCLCVWVGVGHVCEFKMSQIKKLDWYQLYTKGRNKEYILPINSVYSNNLNPLIASSKAGSFCETNSLQIPKLPPDLHWTTFLHTVKFCNAIAQFALLN